MYRVYSNNQEMEVTKLCDTLTTYTDDSKVSTHLLPAQKQKKGSTHHLHRSSKVSTHLPRTQWQQGKDTLTIYTNDR